MKKLVLVVALLVGCPSGSNRSETLGGVAVSGGGGDPALEYSAAVAQMFEVLAGQACACRDQGCSMLTLAAYTEYQDGLQQQEMTWEVADLEACWQRRAQRAIDGFQACLEQPAPFAPGQECGAVSPAVATTDAWWKRSKPCPGDAELEIRKLEGAKVPIQASCIADGVDRARYTSWHPNGSVFVDELFSIDGVRHGVSTVYYPHGRPASKRTYVHGAAQGVIEDWYPDGKPRARRHVRAGVSEGPWTTWDRAGVETTKYYENDYEVEPEEVAATKARSCNRQCIDDKLPVIDEGAVDYSVSAERNFEKGTEAAAAGRWSVAALYFDFVRVRFPDSSFKPKVDQEMAKHAAEYQRPYAACTRHCGACAAACSTDETPCTAHCATRFPIP